MPLLPLADRDVFAALGGQPFDRQEPTLVLVHGAAMDRTVWQFQTRYLAHHGVRVLAVDLPGHGKTPGALLAGAAEYADWLCDVVAELAIGPVHVAGHSMGSFIALEAAARQPDLVASLTLLGTAAGMPVHPALLEAAEANDPLASQLMSGWAFSPSSKVGTHASPGASVVGGTQALIQSARPGTLAADLVLSSGYSNALEAAQAVKARTTLVLGRLDRMTPLKAATSLVDALPEPDVVILDGTGHMMMIERPAEVRRVLLDVALHAGSELAQEKA